MVYTHGIPNFVRVDESVYRSGQITTQEGWDYVHTIAAGRHVHVIKLNFDTEGSDELAAKMGFDVHVLAIEPRGDQDWWDDLKSVFRQPDETIVEEAERLLSLVAPTDFYIVHCTHGQDRTGYVIGRHRVEHDGWTKDAAYQEMVAHHFHSELHGVHEAWESYKPANQPKRQR
jgi:hypothetical protein